MNNRIPSNTNLTAFTARNYRGYRVLANHCPLAREYLDVTFGVLEHALWQHPRTFAFRVDLHLPGGYDFSDSKVISRFWNSLRSKIKSDFLRKSKSGRVHPSELNYIWARECPDGKPHYHLVVLLNADAYDCLGRMDAYEGNLAAMVKQAWTSALGRSGDLKAVSVLVHFPQNAEYRIDRGFQSWQADFADLFYRASYLTKIRTKVFGNQKNTFGHSFLSEVEPYIEDGEDSGYGVEDAFHAYY